MVYPMAQSWGAQRFPNCDEWQVVMTKGPLA